MIIAAGATKLKNNNCGEYGNPEQSNKAEFLKIKNKDYTGIIYSLFGYLYEAKGDYEKAITYFQKALYYDRFSALKEISAAVLNKIGMIYYEKFNHNKPALEYL